MSICHWSAMDEKVLFIPDPSIGPCVGHLLGLTIKGKCGVDPLGIGGRCGAVYFTVRIDRYDSHGNITENVSSLPCTDTTIGANCGEYSSEKNICLDPPAPHLFGIWDNAHYRVIVNFYDINRGNCGDAGALFDQLIAYIWFDYGSWSVTDNPYP